MNVLKKLNQEGFMIEIIAPEDDYTKLFKSLPGISHTPLKHLKRRGLNPIKDLKLLLELYGHYRQHKPDLVLHYTVKPNVYGAFAAALNKIPSVAVITGLGFPFINKGMLTSVTKTLYKFSARFHKNMVFENRDDLLLFRRLKIIRSDQGISLKGCGVNVEYFKPSDEKKSSNKTVFSFIGRLLYDKGLREYVEAAKLIIAKYPDVEFWIIGNFDEDNPAAVSRKSLNTWLIKDKILYKGFQEDVREAIAMSDCIVLPSYREAIARTLTEAMAMERPVITTDAPGCNETVDDGINGFVVPVRDHRVLSEAFVQFLQLSPGQRVSFGKNGRLKVLAEFDDRVIADQIYRLIHELTG
jgi:glycosyltransferase involved in cell wall biosynthesis